MNGIFKKLLPTIAVMNRILFHPVMIFVVLLSVSIAMTVLWVVWYVNQQTVEIKAHDDLGFLIAGCILLAIVILGTVMLFVLLVKQSRLNSQQRSFVSSVTHELRSPIAGMQLSIETIQQRNLEQEVVDKLHNMITKDLDRLVNLVDQILLSARLDRGIKIFNHAETFDLRTVISEALTNTKYLDQNLAQRIEITCPETIKFSTARPAISLIVNNLIENAIKYSPQDSKIKISATQHASEVLLAVKDYGFGLDKSEKKRIFKIFNRGLMATKRAVPGTGLGLYIVKSVVNVLGGRVWVESPGRSLGSTFFVNLPTNSQLPRSST